MTLRLLLVGIAALAVAIGFALPGPRDGHAGDRSQVAMQEIGQS